MIRTLIILFIALFSFLANAQWLTIDSTTKKAGDFNYAFKVEQQVDTFENIQSETPIKKEAINYPLKKGLKHNTFLFGGFLFFFIIIIYIKLASPDYLNTIYQNITSGNFFINEMDKSKSGYSLNNTLLDLLFLLVLSIFFYELLWDEFNFFYLEILAGITVFYLAQVSISFVFHYIFFGSSHRNVHLLNVVLFNRSLAIVITPIIFVSTYLSNPFKDIVSQIILIFIAIIYIYRIVRVLTQLKKLHRFNYLYIFLYLCVFELSLYFIFIKQIGWFFN